MCSKCYILVQCNIILWLIITTGLSQWHYGHAVIVTVIWGLLPPTDQVLNDQPTTLSVLFGGVSQHMQKHIYLNTIVSHHASIWRQWLYSSNYTNVATCSAR